MPPILRRLKSAGGSADTAGHHGIGHRRTRRGGVTAAEQPRRPGGSSRFTISRAGGTVIVSIEGEVGADSWAVLGAVLRDLIDAQGNLDVVLDLCEVAHLEGDAVPLIVNAAHQAHSHGGRLRLADRACRGRGFGATGGRAAEL